VSVILAQHCLARNKRDKKTVVLDKGIKLTNGMSTYDEGQ